MTLASGSWRLTSLVTSHAHSTRGSLQYYQEGLEMHTARATAAGFILTACVSRGSL